MKPLPGQLTQGELATSPFDPERLCDRCDQPIVGPIFKEGIERIGRCCKMPVQPATSQVRPPFVAPPLLADTPVANLGRPWEPEPPASPARPAPPCCLCAGRPAKKRADKLVYCDFCWEAEQTPAPAPQPAPLLETPMPAQPEPTPIQLDPDAQPGKCRILGCKKQTRSRGLCGSHYALARLKGVLDQVGLPLISRQERSRIAWQARMEKNAIHSLETPLRPALKSRLPIRLTRENLKHRLLCLEEADKIREGLAKNSPLTWDGYELPLVYFRPLLEQRAAELEAAALEVRL